MVVKDRLNQTIAEVEVGQRATFQRRKLYEGYDQQKVSGEILEIRSGAIHPFLIKRDDGKEVWVNGVLECVPEK